MLRTLEGEKKFNWKADVAPLVHAYNASRHASTKFSPFYLMFGRKPRLAIDLLLGGEEVRAVSQGYSKFVESLRKNLQSAYKVAMQGAEKAREVQKRHFDLRARAGIIEVGDRVLVRILAHGGKHKLADNWERDPYVVLRQPNHDLPVFVVQLENGKGPRRTLHRNHLLSVTALPILPQKEPPKVTP